MTQLVKQIEDGVLKSRALLYKDTNPLHKFEINVIEQMVKLIEPLCVELQQQCQLRGQKDGKTQKQIQSFVKKQVNNFKQKFINEIHSFLLYYIKDYKFNYEGVVDIKLKQDIDNNTVVISQNSTCNMLMIKLTKVFEGKTAPHYKKSTSY